MKISEDVVGIIDGAPFAKSEFEYEYARSVGSREAAAADSLAAYEDFLERFVNYRIKVLEAKEAGLESDSAIVAELASYRNQYARPYLINQKVLDPIIEALYERSQSMVEASHILLRTAGDLAPEDTLKLYNKISALRDSALAGVDFGDLAVRHSEDPSASVATGPLGYRGYLGFFSAGSMVPQFEDWAYRTPVGEVSPVFRTRYGYHILQVSGKKPTPSDISISHIMITPKGQTESDSSIARVLADSIYQKAARGDDFAALAAAFSDDKQSGQKGGSLGRIDYGSRLIPAMKEVAFAIPEVGGVGEPLLTRFGYHVIKLDEIFEGKSLDESYDDLKAQASRSPKAKLGENAFADSVQVAAGMTLDSLTFFSALQDVAPDSIIAMQRLGSLPDSDAPVFSVGSQSLTLKEVVDKIQWQRYRGIRDKSAMETQRVALRDFLRAQAIDYEVAALESRDESFRATMKEFRNGILLFRLMEDSVWTAAATDTVGLMQEYESDPSRFNYSDRTRLITFFSSNKAPLETIHNGLENGSILAVADSVLSAVRIDTTYLAGPSNSIYDRGLEIEKGANTGILAYNSGSIVIVNDGIDPARPKTFDESRAELINIVQAKLEDTLVERLRSKFGVATYPAHLHGVFSGAMNSDAQY